MRLQLLLATLILCAALGGSVSGQSITNPIVTDIPLGPGPVVPTQMPGSQQGYFAIYSVPSGADVYFDGSFRGESPVTVTVSTTGTPRHTIMVSAPGYNQYTQTYNGNPMPGQTITITATLTPSPQTGSIYVTSSPLGATVILDRSQTAITPYTYSNVPVGTHEIALDLSGYQTYYTSVNVQAGQTATVNAFLTPVTTTGSLSVSSSPSGAAVYVDGLYRGITSTIVGNLAQGSHSVRLSKAGYQDWTGSASIVPGATTYLSPTLVVDQTPAYGTATITTNPTGASVYANGQYVGQTSPGGPLVFSQVIPGTYTVLISRSGYQDYTSTVQVLAGQNYNLAVTLTPVSNPTSGSISVSSSPSGANVYLNNEFKGLSPLTVSSLTPGTYTVMLRLSGYQDWQANTQVTAGQTSQLSATLISAATPTPTKTGALPVTVFGALGLLALIFWRRT
jgi:hypothetical protein